MRKILFAGFVLLSLLALVTGTVSAAPQADGLITLVEVRNDRYGSVIFVFNVSGEFARHKLNGTVDVQGEDAKYGLHCSLVSDDTIQCTTSKKTGGRNVIVYLAGFVFWAFVPEVSGPAGPSQYCYNVYDVWFDEQNEDVYWYPFTTHCQETPANYGDVENIYNPDYQDYYDYEFLPSSPGCFDPVVEDAYYYVCGS
ncbi:MAG: hypothetical protein JNM02_02390 [Anaerolineales bacterium]|nr:hypothetical protein [Anaerolineales bacterium]